MISKQKRTNNNIKPFLRWAGGKSKLINSLMKYLPPDFSNGNKYFEPFLGAGSLFFNLEPSKAILSDNNKDLIECFQGVKERPDLISTYLQQHLSKTCEKYYYQMRTKYNNSNSSITRAALFIYLNKTCFNGIWRVNRKGQFNVPYGHKEPPALPPKNDLLYVSQALSNVKIIHKDYKTIIHDVNEGDFIYFDPPYPPLNGTSFFTHYTSEGFNLENHAELAEIAKELKRKNCFILISNADTPDIRNLYENDFNIFELEVMRWISANGQRYKAKEVAITNYEI